MAKKSPQDEIQLSDAIQHLMFEFRTKYEKTVTTDFSKTLREVERFFVGRATGK